MNSTPHKSEHDSPSLLDKLDEIVPTPLAEFDAFPKLPSAYKTRSESRGFLTLFVGILAFFLILNDLGEYIWGWPHYEFSVDRDRNNNMNVNVDLVVNMPCQYLSVDLRDAVGDRLYLSSGFKRDGTKFDVGQATALQEHSDALSARQAISQSRSSHGFFSTLFQRSASLYKPTYNYQPDGSACRVFGTVVVKKVTANLHITTAGHGYQSRQHVDHKLMNLSHVITEFSFGPYFPDITQPLDNSLEIANDPFVAYQYFLHVVPTTYIAPRSSPLRTAQYSVTHYTRVLGHHTGTPGIFFKFDLDPLSLEIQQRTTSFVQFAIRCVGVIGGIFVCMGYAVKITTHAVEAVSGSDKSQGIVAAEASGIGRKRWGSTDLHKRSGSRILPQGSGWVVEGGSPYGSYAGTPVSNGFPSPALSSYSSPGFPGSVPVSPNPNGPPPSKRSSTGYAMGLASPPVFGPSSQSAPTPYSPVAATSPIPGSAFYSHFPPTPNGASTFPPAFSAHVHNGGATDKIKKDD